MSIINKTVKIRDTKPELWDTAVNAAKLCFTKYKDRKYIEIIYAEGIAFCWINKLTISVRVE
jgi:hypothetical protein